MAPSIDRRNKPDMLVAPKVDRHSKPGVKVRDYVNLGPIRSATVKECSRQPPRTGGNVQRSRSAAADFESEGYLYMDSPKRTDSSTRYSKKDRQTIPEEEESETYEYMCLKKDDRSSTYMNCKTPIQTTEKKEASPERTTPVSLLYVSFVCLFNIFYPKLNILKDGANHVILMSKIGLDKSLGGSESTNSGRISFRITSLTMSSE